MEAGKCQFMDNEEVFYLENPENTSYLYFPVAGEEGLKSSVTPELGGDAKIDQNTFLLEPVSVENLHNNRSTRNFWCRVANIGSWSVTGVSAEEIGKKFTNLADESSLEAGFMWQKTTRTSKKYQLRGEVTIFVPVHENVEIMQVTITNTSNMKTKLTPIAAVPVYGRSADNIRDHRHVTSLLHRTETTKYGVRVKPELSFDERGHKKNDMIYYVSGFTQHGEAPEEFYPTVAEYIGEGGCLERPLAVVKDIEGKKAGAHADGKEAMGALRFPEIELKPQEQATYIILSGIASSVQEIEKTERATDTLEKAQQKLAEVKTYWKEQVNVSYHTGDNDFDHFMKWVSFQPILRRIYGCSFLPHHDYGRGGRGWRDLWQDCLALLMMNPGGVGEMLLNHFGGVRMDGSNATIIGSKPGEFVADRNNITRVWMDHGVWPFRTVKFYLDQTGDLEILNKEVSYFKDRQILRGTKKDDTYDEKDGVLQQTVDGKVYYGTVLEHLLVQNLTAFYEVGEHNHMRMRGADWNDALDMAEERGESVAFTNAYAMNLRELAECVKELQERSGVKETELAEELQILLKTDTTLFDSIEKKTALLEEYGESVSTKVSGKKVKVSLDELAKVLSGMSDWIMQHIRNTEWINDPEGGGWYNGYYDNSGRQVEGVKENNIRMTLTGQVFSVMAKTAEDEQVKAIIKSADRYLYQPEIGGYRLNTNFEELKMDLGRMFGFAYGEKENGAVFSHMAVMYANALYQRGFADAGYRVLDALEKQSMSFEKSKIYPGIPEYFNGEGRGMYHYLTGAASWYMMTVVTQMYGVRGEFGDLIVEPKLMAEQFDRNGKADLELEFAGRKLTIVIENKEKRSYGDYKVKEVCSENQKFEVKGTKAVISRKEIEKLDPEKRHTIQVVLGSN